MQRGDHLRALAHRGGHALDGTGADVANGEHPRHAGLHRPMRVAEFGAGADETALVERHAGAGQPASAGLRADEQEQVAQWQPRLGARARVSPGDGLEDPGFPSSRVTSAWVTNSTLGRAAMRSMR